MHPFPLAGALQPISPLVSAGDTPRSTSASPPPSSSQPTAPNPTSAEPSASGSLPSVASSTTASDVTLPHQLASEIIPLSASEAAWCKEYCSHVNQVDVSALTFEPERYDALVRYNNRFKFQAGIQDTDLGQMIDELSAYLNCKVPTPRALAHYFKEMSAWPAPIVQLAFERARRNWTFTKLPLIGDFKRWVAAEMLDRDTAYNEIRGAIGRLALPRRQAADAAKREARSQAISRKADEHWLSVSREDRVKAFQKYLSPENAARAIQHYDAIAAQK